MPGMGVAYRDRSAEMRAKRDRQERRRRALWEAEKLRSLAAHGWAPSGSGS